MNCRALTAGLNGRPGTVPVWMTCFDWAATPGAMEATRSSESIARMRIPSRPGL